MQEQLRVDSLLWMETHITPFKAQRISLERKERMQELDEGKKDHEGLCYGQDMAKEVKTSQKVSLPAIVSAQGRVQKRSITDERGDHGLRCVQGNLW